MMEEAETKQESDKIYFMMELKCLTIRIIILALYYQLNKVTILTSAMV